MQQQSNLATEDSNAAMILRWSSLLLEKEYIAPYYLSFRYEIHNSTPYLYWRLCSYLIPNV